MNVLPRNSPPTINRPTVRQFARRVVLIWSRGSIATAIPATPPERIRYGRIKNSTDTASMNVPMMIIAMFISFASFVLRVLIRVVL